MRFIWFLSNERILSAICFRPLISRKSQRWGSSPVAVYKLHVLWRSATSLRFSAALGNSSKLDCARLHENSRHIVRFALIRALRTRLLSLRSVVPSRHLTHNFTLALHKRSFYLPTNFTNFRAREHRAEFIRNLPSAAENIELVKIRATYKVAIIWTLCYSCIFVKFVGK